MRTSVACAFAAAVFAGAIAGCTNTISTPPTPQQSTVPVPLLSIHVTGRLKYVGDVALVTATQGSYTGPFTYISSNGAVLALSLAAPADAAAHGVVEKSKQSLVSPNGTAYVTVVGPGTATVSIAGTGGTVATPPTLHVTKVPAAGGLVLAPSSLSFTVIGSSHTKAVEVAQGAYAGTFAESDTCSKIATLTASSNASGEAHYKVTPVGVGSCTATFTGGQHKSAALPISVLLPPGRVVVTPSTVSFSSVLPSDSQRVAVSQSHFAGAFTESDTCAKIATLSAASNATYTVKPAGPGSCTATFTGGGGRSGSLSIDVTLPAPVIAVVCAQTVDACSGGTATAPGSVQLTAVGDTAALTPSDPKWTNAPDFTLKSDTCNKTDDPSAGGNWATLAPAVGKSAASFTVTAKGAGTTSNKANCVATFADGAGRKVQVNVEITLGSVGINAK